MAVERTRLTIRYLPPSLPEHVFLNTLSPWLHQPTATSNSEQPTDQSKNSETKTWTIKSTQYLPGKLRSNKHKVDVPSRAYIYFETSDQVAEFHQAYSKQAFRDCRGNVTFPRIEFAPYQKLCGPPRKPDSRVNTIDSEPEYVAFLKRLEQGHSGAMEVENYEENKGEETEKLEAAKITPLIEHLRSVHKAAQERSHKPLNRQAGTPSATPVDGTKFGVGRQMGGGGPAHILKRTEACTSVAQILKKSDAGPLTAQMSKRTKAGTSAGPPGPPQALPRREGDSEVSQAHGEAPAQGRKNQNKSNSSGPKQQLPRPVSGVNSPTRGSGQKAPKFASPTGGPGQKAPEATSPAKWPGQKGPKTKRLGPDGELGKPHARRGTGEEAGPKRGPGEKADKQTEKLNLKPGARGNEAGREAAEGRFRAGKELAEQGGGGSNRVGGHEAGGGGRGPKSRTDDQESAGARRRLGMALAGIQADKMNRRGRGS